MRLLLSVVLCCAALLHGGEAASCSYPDQWAAEGVSFQPVRYFTNLPECQKSTIFVHYPSRTMQVRSFGQNSGKVHETSLWVFRDGQRGFSVNTPMFSRGQVPYTERDKKRGVCDVMIFETGDDKPMAGAIELHQNLTDLKPIRASDGSIRYYEKNFTSHQVLQLSMKVNEDRFKTDPSSASNYLYSAFSHRVKINSKGECVPISFLRYVYFGASCKTFMGGMLPNKLIPDFVEYFYAANPATYKPGEIGKYDHSVPQLSCKNDFRTLNVAKEKVASALADGRCISASKLDSFIHTCCKMTYKEYTRSVACDLTHAQLFKPHYNSKSRIWAKICENRKRFEAGAVRRVFHRDSRCKTDF